MVITIEAFEGGGKAFLDQVQRCFGVPDVPPDQSIDGLAVTPHDLCESILSSRERQGRELPVRTF